MCAAMSIQREYCRYGRDSWLAYLRSSPGNNVKWVATIKGMLADRWVDAWVNEEIQPGVGESGSTLKRPASPAKVSPPGKKTRVYVAYAVYVGWSFFFFRRRTGV